MMWELELWRRRRRYCPDWLTDQKLRHDWSCDSVVKEDLRKAILGDTAHDSRLSILNAETGVIGPGREPSDTDPLSWNRGEVLSKIERNRRNWS